MLKSMTAFGRARRTSEDMSLDITVEIKSVNSRFLDCSVKISRMFSFLEEKVRSYLTASGILRGKVEVYIGVDVIEKRGTEVSLDTEAAKSYIDALCKLRDTFGLHDDISVMSVAQNRDLFTMRKPDDDMEKDWNDIRPVLDEALAGYNQMREREGINLCTDILGKAEVIKASAAKIKELSAADIQGYPAKLEARIRQLLSDFDVQTSEQRILTEAAIFADKAAIDEELVRLSSHFAALDEIMAGSESAGRKLDFLVQEINREINTIGSKAGNAEIAHLVVDMKTELEKIREQIQNLE
ncbi:MAG: YicC family protein [Clostridia bacterium]|nr:YicC family protein [Clostridia bacterium]